MAVAYTKLTHLDGRTQTRPTAGFEKNKATYEAAGWREAGTGEAPDASGVRIVSLHNAEKVVTEAEFADIYEPAGWKRVDEKAAGDADADADAAAEQATPQTKRASR